MLPRQFRLRRSEDFRRTVRGGVRVGRPTLVLHAALSEKETTPLDPRGAPEDTRVRAAGPEASAVQVGFVVGKTVGNAVTRNRVRRRLRHLAAAELPRTPEPVRIVVRALSRAATAPDEVPADFASAWPQALSRLAQRPADPGAAR